MISKADTFRCREYASNHRCFVISESDHCNMHLVVNMSSLANKPNADKSCILKASDAPSGLIYEDSFIKYDFAFELLNSTKVPDILQIPATTLRKIQDGAKTSKHLERRFKKYFDLF